jgi:hypothetical protein
LLFKAEILFEYSENILDIKGIANDFGDYLLRLFLLLGLFVLLIFLVLGRCDDVFDVGTSRPPRLGVISIDESHAYVIS